MNKKEIVLKYIEKFPTINSKSELAKIIFKDHPKVWTSSESVRSSIRYLGKNMAKPKTKLPNGNMHSYKPFIIKHKKGLFLFDIHIPFHNREAVEEALHHAEVEKVDFIYLGGDCLDSLKLGNYLKSPTEKDYCEELKIARGFLTALRNRFTIPIYYKCGNHEVRLTNYLMQHAPQLYKLKGVDLPSFLELDKLKIEWIGDKNVTYWGKYNLLHGHETKTGGKHAANNILAKTFDNTICGHFHRSKHFSVRTIRAKYIHSYVAGCMSELNAPYLPYNNWNNGYLIGTNNILNNVRL